MPTDNIKRQDAATLVARAMGLLNENADHLYRYTDSDSVSDYARNFVSAVTEQGYMMGSYSAFRPHANLSRAEAVKIVDNMFRHYYQPETGFDNFTVNGNIMSRRAESVFNGLTVNGDLILADGVGNGKATLNNCLINGRLLLRGGGPFSVVLNDTRITDGITVISPTSNPRIVTTGSTVAPQLTAFSGFTLNGTGVHSLNIPDTAFYSIYATLDGVMLNTAYVGGLGATIDLKQGQITNLHVGGAADGATCILAAETMVDYMSTVSPNTTLRGAGWVGNAFINAPGAVLAITPDNYTIGANLSAAVGGLPAAGQVMETGNTVTRHATRLAVSQDARRFGGENLRISSSQGRSSNSVLVTQNVHTKIPLDNVRGRLGYYIGFFIPAPFGIEDYIPMLTYSSSDGGLIIMRDVSLTYKGDVCGLEFHIPVRREAGSERGRLEEMLFVQWNSQTSENLQFYSGWLDLQALQGFEESELLQGFYDNIFYGYDGTHYRGAEALRRLLSSDNPLGLDLRGFADFTEKDQSELAARLYEYSDTFSSVEAIQAAIDKVIAGRAALFAVNNAVTVAQMRAALENPAFARELNIEIGSGSLYDWLSNLGKERVARIMLYGRNKDFANAAAVKAAFDKAVTETRTVENALLVAINAAKGAAEVQRIIEVKNNADVLNFFPALEPYKSCKPDVKLELGLRILNGAPFYSVDDVARIIQDFLNNLSEEDVAPEITVISVTVSPLAMPLLVGQTANFTVSVNNSNGLADTSFDKVKITYTNPHIIDVDETNGEVYAKEAGSSRITVTSIADPKKSAAINVTVKVPIPSTAVTLNLLQVEVEEGQTNTLLKATMAPANTTDTITWTTADATIATVSAGSGGMAIIKGESPGFTKVTARTSSNKTATALVIVVSKEPGVMVYAETDTIGIDQSVQLLAVVSPISAPDRRVRWSSADSSKARVDTLGKVTGLVETEPDEPVEITATAVYYKNPEQSDSVFINVDASIRTMSLNKKKIVMVTGGFEDLIATLRPPQTNVDVILWDVGEFTPGVDPNFIADFMPPPFDPAADPADVNGVFTGRVKALGPGKAYAYAYLDGNPVMSECEVEVLNVVLNITMNLNYPVTVGDNVTTGVPSFNPASITNRKINWEWEKAADRDYASFEVNSNGSVTITGLALPVGQSSYVARLKGTPQARPGTPIYLTITVRSVPLKGFTLTESRITLYHGESRWVGDPSNRNLLGVTPNPANATNKQITWSSENPSMVSVNNEAPTPDNPFGHSRINATSDESMTTIKSKIVGYDEAGNPIYEEYDDPIRVTATSVDGGYKQVVLVSVHKRTTSQLNNLKIRAESWVFPLGRTQTLPVLFNVISRDGSGNWQTGTLPPNTNIAWSWLPSQSAKVGNNNVFEPLRPGKVRVTATAEDGGVSDTVTFVIGKYGIEEMSFSGLDTVAGYGRHMHMYMGGDSRSINATFLPLATSNEPAVWLPYHWKYTVESDDNNTAGATAGLAYDVLNIPSSSPFNRAAINLTSNKAGLVRVEVIPTDDMGQLNLDTIASKSINELEALCNSLDISWGETAGTLFARYLDKNDIIIGADDEYYTGNEANLVGFSVTITPRPLSKTIPMTLVIPNVIDGNNFYVWVTGRPLQSVIFTIAQNQNREPEQTITLTAKVNSDIAGRPYVRIDDPSVGIKWNFDADVLEMVPGSAHYDEVSGICSATFKVLADTEPGPVSISVSVTSDIEYGLKSPGVLPRQKVGGDTVTANYTLRVIAPVEPALAALSSPVINPAPAIAPATAAETANSAATVRSLNIELSAGLSTATLTQAAISEAMPSANTVYESSNTAVAVVNSSGIVTAVAPGSAVIKAVNGSRAVTAEVKVAPSSGVAAATAKGLALRSAATVTVGKSITLAPVVAGVGYDLSAVAWSSSKPDIATVDNNGLVRGVKAGKAVITATVPGTKLKATCTVTVGAAPKTPISGITLSNSVLSLEAGKTATLKINYLPGAASLKGAGWFSSDSAVAAVDHSGKITAITAGSAVISAVTDEGGHIASCTVTVNPAPVKVTGITLNYSTLALARGEQFTLAYTINPENAANQNITWTTSNKNIVTVADGRITALKKGTATITITTEDGKKKATCKVTVK